MHVDKEQTFVTSHTEIHLIDMIHQEDVSGKANRFITLRAEVGSNELHLLRYIYLSKFFG